MDYNPLFEAFLQRFPPEERAVAGKALSFVIEWFEPQTRPEPKHKGGAKDADRRARV